MTLWQKSFCTVASLLCLGAAEACAQTADGTPCFAVHVRLNGKPVADPKTLTFKTKEMEILASSTSGCFKAPNAMLREETVEVLFTIPGNNIHLAAIQPGFFAGPWDIDLADRRFNPDIVLAKHARVKEACAVVFHVGKSEIAQIQTKCRTSL